MSTVFTVKNILIRIPALAFLTLLARYLIVGELLVIQDLASRNFIKRRLLGACNYFNMFIYKVFK